MTKPIRVYMHVNDMPGAWDVLEEQLNRIEYSGLMEAAESVALCTNGKPESFAAVKEALADYDKVRFVHVAPDAKQYEYPTLDFMQDECEAATEDFYICYIHLKGLTRPTDQNVIDWRHFMEYWTIDCWEDSVEYLDEGNDVTGTNFIEQPWLHSSGNFWWSHANYIKTLERLPKPANIQWGTPSKWINATLDHGNFRYEHEAWIGTGNPKWVELASTPGKETPGWHFENAWPESNYLVAVEE